MMRGVVSSLVALLLAACGPGERGPEGAQGPQGPQGEQGPSGLDYTRIKVVSPGANAEAGGTALLAALDSITTASSETPWLIQLEPGTYDLGARTLMMKPFISVQGAGQQLTRIASDEATRLVVAAENTELSALTVGSALISAGGATGVEIAANRFSLHDVTISLLKASGASVGILHAAGQGAGSIERVKVMVDSGSGSATGIFCNQCTLKVRDSELHGRGQGVEGVFAANQAEVELNDVTVVAAARDNSGIGLRLNQVRSALITRVDARGLGSAYGIGILLDDTPATIRDSFLMGQDDLGRGNGLKAENVSSQASQLVEVHGSVIVGEQHTVYRGRGYRVRIADSQLSGGPSEQSDSTTGALTCYGVYDEGFTNAGGINACP